MTSPPTVYIEREPLLNMILAAVEPFKRECLGHIFGRKPNSKRNSYVITHANAVQCVGRRLNLEVSQAPLALKRVRQLFAENPGLYPVLGDFHSHPEWGGHKRLVAMSDTDIADTIKEQFDLAIVIGISTRKRDRVRWEYLVDGGIRGSVGNFVLRFNVFRLIEKKGKQVPQRLQVIAPSALRLLNRQIK